MAELPVTLSPTREAIYAAYENDNRDGFRAHLGASIIGKPCERALFYDFRWVTKTQHEGRLLRLFETGQLEEARLVENLRRIGATVLEVDPDTGRQFRVQAHGGHFGGSLDGVAFNLHEAPKTWHVLEFKTHSSKSFKDLVSKTVRPSKPQHWAQMQIYMHLMGVARAMYLAVNKDTDELYVERVEVDAVFAKALLEKAGRVIFAQDAPPKISDDPSWYECRLCDHAAVCHGGSTQPLAAQINCRTCLHATPVEGGWQCELEQKSLSEAEQRQGCKHHLYLPSLVPGTQVDAGPGWVQYQFADGRSWRDVGKSKQTQQTQSSQGSIV
jgi:hypothetical protein